MGKPGEPSVYLPTFGLASTLKEMGFDWDICGLFLLTQVVGVGCVCREGEGRGTSREDYTLFFLSPQRQSSRLSHPLEKPILTQTWGHGFPPGGFRGGAGRVEQQNLEEKMASMWVFSFLQGSRMGLLCQTSLWSFLVWRRTHSSRFFSSLGNGAAGVSKAACDLIFLMVSCFQMMEFDSNAPKQWNLDLRFQHLSWLFAFYAT